jgi:hypothetical protein
MGKRHYTFIACWWEKYENLFTQEYHIPQGHRPKGIWYSWVNNISYFLNVLLYQMKPRKHIYVKYCWEIYSKSIGTLSQIFKNHIVTVACEWCVPSVTCIMTSFIFILEDKVSPQLMKLYFYIVNWPMGLNTSTLCFRRIYFAVYKRCERRTTMGKNCQQISLQRLKTFI